MLTNKVTGSLSEDEARQLQTFSYEEDLQKFHVKQKEKEDKRKKEKFKRYGYLFAGSTGQKLPEATSGIAAVRSNQQDQYDEEGVYGYIKQLEAENERLRREEQRRQEKIRRRFMQVETGSRLGAASSQSEMSPRRQMPDQGERLPFEENSINIQSPRPVNESIHNNSLSDDCENIREEKEKAFQAEMRKVRERMQNLYSEGLNKNN